MTDSPNGRRPPRSVDEALRRSIEHARNAAAEALLAGHALLDAVAIGVAGRPASGASGTAAGAVGPLATLSHRIEQLAQMLRAEGSGLPDGLARPLLEALEAEIERWEARAVEDRDARAVLRAFLGLREILWELGVRGGSGGGSGEGSGERADDEVDGLSPDDAEAAFDRRREGPAAGGPPTAGRGASRPARRSARVRRIEVED